MFCSGLFFFIQFQLAMFKLQIFIKQLRREKIEKRKLGWEENHIIEYNRSSTSSLSRRSVYRPIHRYQPIELLALAFCHTYLP